MDENALNAWVRVIGAKLRAARIKSGLSIRDVFRATKVSVSSVQRSESGETDVCVRMLARLCSVYGIEPRDVMPLLVADPPPPKKRKGK